MPSEPARPLSLHVDHVFREPAATNLNALRTALRSELLLRRQPHMARAETPISVFGFADEQLSPLAGIDASKPENLLGLEVPDRFEAVAAVAASVMTSSTRSHADAVLAVAVTRDDHELCFLTDAAEIAETWQPQGWLIDACRRAVGLPTRPASALPVDLSLALWLDYLLVALVEQRAVTWFDAVACCPVTMPTIDAEPELLGLQLASTVPPWSMLRAAASAGAPLPVPMRAEHAAWMDDPMFARWVLGFFPDLDDLRSDIAFLAPAEVADGVERAVRVARS